MIGPGISDPDGVLVFGRIGKEILLMKRKRFSVEQIVAVLKQAEVGVPVAQLIRQVGITEQTLY